MDKFDENLSFALSEGYSTEWRTDENDGSRFFCINGPQMTDDDGDEIASFLAQAHTESLEDSPFGGNVSGGFPIKGNVESYGVVQSRETSVAIFTMEFYLVKIYIKKGDLIYSIAGVRTFRADSIGEKMEQWVGFLNTVLASAVLGGTKVRLEKLTAEQILDSGEASEESDFPIAKPQKNQHGQYDYIEKAKASLSFLGGLVKVNQGGTEIAFQPLDEMADEADEENSAFARDCAAAQKADTAAFDLAETAETMAELFRVNLVSFDAAHDREQEIKAGLIQRVNTFEALRSFAWTLGAYCDKNGIEAAAVDYDTIEAMADFIDERKNLNYAADSFAPALCSGDDIHVFYLPDATPQKVKKALAAAQGGDSPSGIYSLDGLRRDLEAMYPAIRAIYDELEAHRDRSEALTGGAADLLYAWCSMTYAARKAFYIEDGPMNCFWGHPDEDPMADFFQNNAEEWLKKHEQDLSPKAPILIKDHIFVFAGTSFEDWPEEEREKFVRMGGMERSAVSGKTDYLVCSPAMAGDSKVKKALEQQGKGKDVKIVLWEDFHEALCGPKKETPPEKKKELKPVDRPAAAPVIRKKSPEDFTYDEGNIAEGDGFSMVIPDGFRILKNVDGRDFIAYIPDENDPDSYINSRFTVFAGQKAKNEMSAQFRTPEEFTAVSAGALSASHGLFDNVEIEKYLRRDLPGCICSMYSMDVLHVNAFLGIGDHLQSMRVMVTNVRKSQVAAYKAIAKELFDRIMVKTPLELLPEPDDEKFVKMDADGKTAKEWIQCVTDTVQHLSIARTLVQNFIVQNFQQDQAAGRADVPKFLKDLKDMLREVSESVERRLIKAEAIYTLKVAQDPASKGISKLRKVVSDLMEAADQSVQLNGEPIKVSSAFGKRVKKRLAAGGTVIPELLSEALAKTLSTDLIEALEKVKDTALPIDDTEAKKRARQEAKRKAEAERREREKAEREAREKAEKEAKEKAQEERKKNLKEAMAMISAGEYHTVALKADGTVLATKIEGSFADEYDHHQCEVGHWRNIVAVAAGEYHTVGLKADGTVVATKYFYEERRYGFFRTYDGQCNVEGWEDIVAISAGAYHTVGLKADGTVVAVGNNECGQCDVSGWRNIVAISAGSVHTVGLRANGTVVAVGSNDSGSCDVSGWRNIVAISAGSSHTVGLKADGTVVATTFRGHPDYYYNQCDVSDWRDIIAVATGTFHTVGLKADGTLVAVGREMKETTTMGYRDIVAVSAGADHMVGLKNDGTLESYLVDWIHFENYGQIYVSGWKLFDNLEETVEKRRKNIEEAAEKRRKAKERAEEERRKAEEQKLQNQIAALESEKAELETKMENVHGLFAGHKRKTIAERLNDVGLQLDSLNKLLKDVRKK